MTDIKENNTGQTVYGQLQEFLNECIKLGYISDFIHKCFVSCDIDGVHFISRDESIHKSIHMSYHDLFSKDSGIMEFVEWKEIYPTVANLQAHYINMCEKKDEEKLQYFIANAKLPTKSE